MRRPSKCLAVVASALAIAACDSGTLTSGGTTVLTSAEPTVPASAAVTPAPADSAAAPVTTVADAPSSEPTIAPTVPTAPPETPAPTSPPTVAPTTPPTPAPTCSSAGDVPVAASDVNWVQFDMDDDGTPDTVTTYLLGGWTLHVALGSGTTSTVELGDLGAGFAQVLGGVHADFALGADGPHPQQALAIAGGGASGYNLAVFGLDDAGCVFRFTDGSGSQLELPVAGSVNQRAGLRCEGAAGSQFLVQLHAESSDGVAFETEDIRLRRNGTKLEADPALTGSLTEGDAALSAYSTVDCGGISLP